MSVEIVERLSERLEHAGLGKRGRIGLGVWSASHRWLRIQAPLSPSQPAPVPTHPAVALTATTEVIRGVLRVRAKMARAVTLAKLMGRKQVDWALGHAAVMERLAGREVPQAD